MSHGEASARYADASVKLAARIADMATQQHEPADESERANARQNLFNLADLLAHDGTKFHFLFKGGTVSDKDALGMLAHSEPSLDKFCAWASTVASESKAVQRELVPLATEVLAAFKTMLDAVVDSRFAASLPTEVCGRIMKAAEAVKKLSKSEAAAVQRQLFKDAANVKTVVKDVAEMVEGQNEGGGDCGGDEVAKALQHMDVGSELKEGGAEFADLMDMDVSLEADELAVVKVLTYSHCSRERGKPHSLSAEKDTCAKTCP